MVRRSGAKSRCLVESLEARALCTITPGHLALMERSVNEVVPTNNVYYNGTPVVTWNGINSQTTTSVKADCTTYITVLLKQAYSISDSRFASMFGGTTSSPSLTRYYDQAVADGALHGFTQIADVKPGDLFISKYADQSSALGHMVMIESAPTLVSVGTQYRAYNVTILDVTGSIHSNDTRNRIDPVTLVNDTGVGRGDIRLYTDLDGNLDHWAWGTKSTSSTYTKEDRPATFANVPYISVNSPTLLTATATSETSVKLTWKDNSGLEDGYLVQRSSDGGATWADVGDTGKNGATYTDTTVVPGQYSYRVWAAVAANQSLSAATGSVTVAPVVPALPTNVSATLSGANVQISWSDNATNEVRYVLERSTDSGNFVAVANTAANTVGYTDTAAPTGHVYRYRLRAESLYAQSDAIESNDVNLLTRSGVKKGMSLISLIPQPAIADDVLALAKAGAAPSGPIA